MKGQRLSNEAAQRMWSELKHHYGRGGLLLFDKEGNAGDEWYSDVSFLDTDVNVDTADDILCECPRSASDLGTLDDFMDRTQRWLDQRPSRRANVLTCPRCRHVDRVVRVRSVYSGGITSQTANSRGVAWTLSRDGLSPSFLRGRTNGVSQSDLSMRLAPLPLSGPTVGGPASGMDLLLGLGAVALVGLVFWLLYGSPGSQFICVVLILADIVFIWGGLARKADFKKTVFMPWYEKYVNAWDSLYYCERCDVVFGIGRKKAVRPEEMNEALLEEVGNDPRYGGSK